MPQQSNINPDLDAIIIGGGVAGLWLLNHLSGEGQHCILLEAETLGGAQTLASQGMVHGGIKYALGGALTGASEAIAGMPARWRAALAGEGPVDLSGLEVLADRYYLFAEGSSLGKLTGFFASRALRGRIERLAPPDYPDGLRNFDGVVYGLPDFVVDTSALLERLRQPVADRIFQLRVSEKHLRPSGQGSWALELAGADRVLHASRLILSAGAGNGPLLQALGFAELQMQLRPLHQVLVRHPELTPLYAHCVTGIRRPEPRLTITSHGEGQGGLLWYLGGQLATDGVDRTEAEQVAQARRELDRCVPWIDWSIAEFETLRIDRAEPEQTGGHRPDEAYLHSIPGSGSHGSCHVCWPTKLSLAPDLADRLAAELAADPAPPPLSREIPELPLPAAGISQPPWVRP